MTLNMTVILKAENSKANFMLQKREKQWDRAGSRFLAAKHRLQISHQ